jgi:pilus assembly protein CpaF
MFGRRSPDEVSRIISRQRAPGVGVPVGVRPNGSATSRVVPPAPAAIPLSPVDPPSRRLSSDTFSRRASAAKNAAAAAAAANPFEGLLTPNEGEPERKSAEPAGARRPGQEALAAKNKVQPILLERIDIGAAWKLPRAELERQIADIAREILGEQQIRLNMAEQKELVTMMLNDMLGFGPLEPLLADEGINDIMVNGAHQVWVERRGKLELTDVRFRDDAHVTNIATRIVTRMGRRIDESSPMVDARLPDGSRVNIIIPPLAIDGPTISIRKFAKKKINFDVMVSQKNLSPDMATVLKIASRCRLNIVISGGTGSGKTTLLNALSQLIDPAERIVTIEDAAELQLQQPHVVRLETRPANMEGHGEVTIRDLVKNSLRMRPDRIILGEIRSAEAIDMLQAMNTGHDGSLGTIHANRPREALTRLENLVGLAGIDIPTAALRTQIASAINMIVQIQRMRDGVRRITHIVEVVGCEGDVITTQDLFLYHFTGVDKNGNLIGDFKSTGLRPRFIDRAEYFGLDKVLLACL